MRRDQDRREGRQPRSLCRAFRRPRSPSHGTCSRRFCGGSPNYGRSLHLLRPEAFDSHAFTNDRREEVLPNARNGKGRIAAKNFDLFAVDNASRDWLLVGLWFTLAFYTKYQAFVLLLPAFAFAVVDPQARRCWENRAPMLRPPNRIIFPSAGSQLT
jgi:hypothetical protein